MFYEDAVFLKKERTLLICFAVIAVAYFVVPFFLPKKFFFENWFFLALFALSLFMFCKAYIFRSDSSLFLASLLLQNSIVGVASQNFSFLPFQILSLVVLSFSISHLAVFLFFGNFQHFFAFIAFFLLFLPMLLFAFDCINLLLMLSSICGEILLILMAILLKRYGKI